MATSSGRTSAGSGDGSLADETIAATDAGAPATPSGVELPPGAMLGRYVVLSRLGVGGMGIVYAAYDPELDRKVAVKLLLRERGSATARGRLLREAQALARLSHPNVVAVHDVGVHGQGDDLGDSQPAVFVAMEFVQGDTLRRWRDRTRRAWAETFAVMMRAGRGLAAAHDEGLVHRDLKPDNVMVSDDGRVRVMDFGLARASTDSNIDMREAARVSSHPRDLTKTLTADGAMPGTPAYMSAERWEGRPADAASDQFGFCATFWECLYGRRAFDEDGVFALGEAIRGERVSEPPPNRDVPGWLRRIVRRGLAADPRARWPSMKALLSELERARRRARWRWVWLGGAGVAFVAAAGFGVSTVQRAAESARCRNLGAEIDAQWNDTAKEQIVGAFARVPGEYGPEAARRTIAVLDDWARAWQGARTDTCMDTTGDLRHQADVCLELRRDELAALLATLQDANAAAVFEGHTLALDLDPPDTCTDFAYLQRQPRLSDSDHESVRAIRSSLRDAERLRWRGEQAAARIAYDAAVVEAERIGLPLAIIEARIAAAGQAIVVGDFAAGERGLQEAYRQAGLADEPTYVAKAAGALTFLLGPELHRLAEARVWSRATEVALARVSDPGGIARADWMHTLAAVEIESGNYEEGRRLLDEVLGIQSATLGEDHPDTVRTVANVGYLLSEAGHPEEAVPKLERATEAYTAIFGETYPKLADLYNNLANARVFAGDLEGADAAARKGMALAERSVGRDHPLTATCMATVALVALYGENFDDAVPLLRKSVAVLEKSLGPAHPHVVTLLANIGVAHEMKGEPALAIEAYELALSRLHAAGPEAQLDVANVMNQLAGLLDAPADRERARRLVTEAVAIREERGTEEDRAISQLTLARIERWDGNLHASLAAAERAFAVARVDPRVHALAAVELASTLHELSRGKGPEARRARAVIEQTLTEIPPGASYARLELEAWQAAH